MILNDQQIDFIDREIRSRGVETPDLADELLDHFCCAIEDAMEAGSDFENAFNKVYLEICPDGLREIEWETKLIQITYKQSVMKKFVFIIGFVTAFIFAIGYAFKMMHWPGANIMIMTGGGLFSLAFLPMYHLLKYRTEKALGTEKPVITYVINASLTMLICLTVPYRFLKWPLHWELGLVALLLLAFVFLPKVFVGWYKKFASA